MADELIDAYDEEGAGSSSHERDWKGMVSAICVIFIISSIIGLIIIIFTPVGMSVNEENEFNAEELKEAEHHFIQQSWQEFFHFFSFFVFLKYIWLFICRWLNENEIVYHVHRKGANIYNCNTQNLTRIADSLFIANSLNESLLSYSLNVRYTAQIIVRPDAFRDPDRLLFSVIIYDNSNDIKYPVGVSLSSSRDEILAFQWSHKSSYSFVYNDQIYYTSAPQQSPIRITNQDENGIIHGVFDWVYKEEIYNTNQIHQGAMWFSPTDTYLAYASRPIKSSKEVVMTTYNRGSAYNYHYNMEYPKTGEKRLPVFSVSIWSVSSRSTRTMDVQLRDSTSFHYLFGVSWVKLHNKELLLTTWANRWQNATAITLCSYENATCSLIYEHKYEEGQWASPEDYSEIVYSESSIFFLLPKSKRGNAWQHIAKVDITMYFQFDSISYLPSGEYDIRHIVAYRPREDLIVYEAQAPLPWNRHVYASPARERSVMKTDRCITCLLSNCTFQGKSSVSPGKDLFIDFSCNGPSQFFQAMVTLNSTVHPIELKIITEPSTKILNLPKWKTETFILSNGYEAIVRIYEGNQKLHSIPLTLVVYGGPHMNQVTDRFESFPRPIGYKYGIVYIDVRGSGGRGWKYRSPIYRGLVTVEVEDTLEAIKMVLAKYPRFDKNRLGVFGWSYGGTMAIRLVQLASESFFKCALAVAPVSNFAYYDATYTERFMGDTPRSSFTDLTLDLTKFMHTKLLLVHGLRDDAIGVYPNQGHSLNHNINEHLGQLFESFLSTCYA
ncbi:dpf-1 [Pristionchus pacificus]|uniref:Dpf-1 n=1 Tax=Pristionchus pacificus TaxID=54126 RepID=A0A2A6CCK1_PRIPA|nr:dpf-1 [Pristionchus pacificus]|eukprot:PDM75932.1 dpf-1 [Pristionchus pacificus]